MHEAAICEALLGQLTTLAARRDWPRLQEVRLRVGLLSGVAPEALEFAFSALAAGTVAEGSALVFETEPARFACITCGEIDHDRLEFVCPRCGGPLRLLHASRDLFLCGVTPSSG
jgi:hydrogenase nickel incorporation protein HypA/HybF